MKKRILLVEDDPFLIDVYTTKLKEEGFLVDIATTGKECLEKMEKESFDLLILDIVLPKVDGWEILEKVGKEKTIKNLKILVLSNLSQKEEVERGIKLGADKYLIKAHHTPSEIIKEIKEMLK